MHLAAQFVRVRSLLARFPALAAGAAPLLTRLCCGQMFVLTGLGKLGNLDRTTEFFRSIGIPFANVQAPMIAALEFAGGIALLLGLWTRTFALLLASTMVVAILTNDGAALLAALPFRDDVTAVAPIPPLLFCTFLLAHGAGPVAIDALLRRHKDRRRAATTPAMAAA